MEPLSYFLKRTVSGGFLSPCPRLGVEGEGVKIFYLLFADDTLVFCKANKDQVTFLS